MTTNHPFSWPLILEGTWLFSENRALRAHRIGHGWTSETVFVRPNPTNQPTTFETKSWQKTISQQTCGKCPRTHNTLANFGCFCIETSLPQWSMRKESISDAWRGLQAPFSCLARLRNGMWLLTRRPSTITAFLFSFTIARKQNLRIKFPKKH